MSTPLSVSVEVGAATARPRLASGFWQRATANRGFVIGAVLTLLLVAAALLSLVWTPYSPYEMNLPGKLQPPGREHWLGTDPFGRDVASLLLMGARASIMVGVIAVSIGLVIGTAFGLLAAVVVIVNFVVDVLYAFIDPRIKVHSL